MKTSCQARYCSCFFPEFSNAIPININRLEDPSIPVGRMLYWGVSSLAFFSYFWPAKLSISLGAWPYHCFRLHTVFGRRSGEVFYAPMRTGSEMSCRWASLTTEPKRAGPAFFSQIYHRTIGEHSLNSELAEVWIMSIKSNSITTYDVRNAWSREHVEISFEMNFWQAACMLYL